jgi:zinc transporter ZupT
MVLATIGALCFGLVIGWIVYRTLRRSAETVALSDIATVTGAVGGAAITGLFKSESLFGAYCVGLAAGFFLYLVIGVTILKDSAWLGSD